MIGFTVISQTTGIEVRLYTPSTEKPSSLVTFSRQNNDFALLIGNLYYQHDLLARLERCCPAPLQKKCSIDAATLALCVYQYAGFASLEALEGDFALVIWDSEMKSFVGMRDPLGGYPLFWTEYGGSVALSTSLWSLLALRGQPSLNEEYFADFLMMPVQRQEGAGESCAYTGVQRILPGTMVQFRLFPFKVERHSYWNWLARINDPGTNTITDLAEQYRPLLSAAVRERLSGRTLSHFSGGMDSTSIALIAQDQMLTGAGEVPLHAISLVYRRLPDLARESYFIDDAIRYGRSIVAHQLPADDLLDFASFLNPPPHEEPYAGLWGLDKDKAMIDMASELGVTTILTGMGADEIHDMHPFYLADLLLHGHLWRAWREACKWASAYHCSPWAFLLPFGIAGLPLTWHVGNFVRRHQKRDRVRLSQQTDWTVPPWVLPDFVRRYTLWDRAAANAHHMYRLCQSTDMSVTLQALESRVGDVLRWSVAVPSGIVIAHPFLDSRLLSFGLGMHARLQPEPDCRKSVLAEAMRDRLPESIRLRQRKGHFNEVYYLGLSRHLQYLETIIQQTSFDGIELFDKNILLKCLQEASIAGANVRQLQRMNYTLAIIQWLTRQHEWRRIVAAPSCVIHVCQNESEEVR